VIPVSDGYVIAGYVDEYNSGNVDVYLLKTDLDGNRVWNTTIGGAGDYGGNAVIVARDGLVLTGNVRYPDRSDDAVLLAKTGSVGPSSPLPAVPAPMTATILVALTLLAGAMLAVKYKPW
jgi:hypothetical protein